MAAGSLAVIGAGLAGVVAALAARRANPGCAVTVYEREAEALAWMERLGGRRLALGWADDDPELFSARMREGGEASKGLFMRVPGSAARQWWDSLGVECGVEAEALVALETARDLALRLRALLPASGIRLVASHAFESAAFSNEAGVRLWFSGQEAEATRRLLLAPGGGANRALAVAGECGHAVEPFGPGCFGVRISDPRLRGLQGIEISATRVELTTGEPAVAGSGEGPLRITGRGLEGPALLAASAACARIVAERGFACNCRINWLPRLSGTGISRAIGARVLAFGKRAIHADPLFELPPPLWSRLAAAARIPADLAWVSCPARKLHALVGQLNGAQFAVRGHFLDGAERTWRGGLQLQGFHPATWASRNRAEIFAAGEVLDFMGDPGAAHTHACLATALLAGAAAAG